MSKNAGTLQDKNGNTLYPGVIDIITNNYGTALKFADGTMITYRITPSITVDVSIAWGNIFRGQVGDYYRFPVYFTEAPFVIWDVVPTGSLGCFKIYNEAPTITNERIDNLSVGRPTAGSPAVKFYILAIGRWK